MKLRLMTISLCLAFAASCGTSPAGNNASKANNNAGTAKMELAVVERPQNIKDLMAQRGEQDAAMPTIKIIEPKADSVINSSTVKVKLELGGDLKGYKPGMDPETHTGNHIHVILDNQPYEAYYNLDREFELRNVADGEHTLRVFPSRPWHESYKNEGAFQIIKFTVKNGGADNTKPTTTAEGNTMAAPTPEGKQMLPTTAGPVDPKKPLLTYSRPKGEYKGADAQAIMIDFWLANAKLVGDGGEYKVKWSVDGGEPRFIEKWEPIWLKGFTPGKHSITLQLVDKDGKPVENGGYNTTPREITVSQ